MDNCMMLYCQWLDRYVYKSTGPVKQELEKCNWIGTVCCRLKRWTSFELYNFKGDFLRYLDFFCTLALAKYCPILTNQTSMESLFIQLSDYL